MECKKVKFANEKYAIDYIDKLKKTSVREVKPIRTYLCFDCGSWHLTSQETREHLLIKKLSEEKADLKKRVQSLKQVINDNNLMMRKIKNGLNISNKDLVYNYIKQGEKNAFKHGFNTFRELMKEIINK
jgi:uncharacterized protein YlaI